MEQDQRRAPAADLVPELAPGDLDEFITPWDAAVYVQAASDPKEVRWYDTDHYFNDEARQDRMDWLARALGL